MTIKELVDTLQAMIDSNIILPECELEAHDVLTMHRLKLLDMTYIPMVL